MPFIHQIIKLAFVKYWGLFCFYELGLAVLLRVALNSWAPKVLPASAFE